MPTLTDLLFLLMAAFLFSIVPGPDMLYIIARSTGQGRSAGMISCLGTATGGLIQTIMVALGLSSLFLLVPVAYEILKDIGAIYLVYLGIRTLLSHQGEPSILTPKKTALATVYVQGMLNTLLNPKSALFYLALLPQFVDPTQHDVTFQILLLGLVTNLVGLTVEISIATLSSFLGAWLKKRLGAAKLLRWFTGCILIGLGVRLALSKRQ
ncbi:LysE family translocator [Dictyobacter formicarum]|uniref:RhtB family transporter n=1 Tax=Dictyobacter formicarum TaxID=2778368 RepID=A0ABQ3V9N9_9CHLR|nr:LysE family translocator [Dictyobacter formicarum]GHO82416.1 RhtB family transporter [Dictyobacter formicarum]